MRCVQQLRYKFYCFITSVSSVNSAKGSWKNAQRKHNSAYILNCSIWVKVKIHLIVSVTAKLCVEDIVLVTNGTFVEMCRL